MQTLNRVALAMFEVNPCEVYLDTAGNAKTIRQGERPHRWLPDANQLEACDSHCLGRWETTSRLPSCHLPSSHVSLQQQTKTKLYKSYMGRFYTQGQLSTSSLQLLVLVCRLVSHDRDSLLHKSGENLQA